MAWASGVWGMRVWLEMCLSPELVGLPSLLLDSPPPCHQGPCPLLGGPHPCHPRRRVIRTPLGPAWDTAKLGMVGMEMSKLYKWKKDMPNH